MAIYLKSISNGVLLLYLGIYNTIHTLTQNLTIQASRKKVIKSLTYL